MNNQYITLYKSNQTNQLEYHFWKPAIYYISFFFRVRWIYQRTFTDTSNWTVVMISLERLINVIFPHDAKALLNHTRALIIVAIVPILITAIDVTFVLAANPVVVQSKHYQSLFKITCVSASNPKKSQALIAIYFAWSSYFPIIIIILSSCFTVLMLMKSRRAIANQDQCNKSQGQGQGQGQHNKSQVQGHGKDGNRKAVSHVTKMLLGICLMFLVTNGVLALYTTIGSLVYAPSFLLSVKNNVHLFASAVYAINYNCNFWVYVLTAPAFRRELRRKMVRSKIFRHCLPGSSRVESRLSSLYHTQSSVMWPIIPHSIQMPLITQPYIKKI